ncbi:MAG: hypothetical protein R2705_18005 [Ilumatobacteraceae bacterium]
MIGQICRFITGAAMSYAWGAENASMHTVVVSGDVWRLHRFNDTSHLTD